MKYVDKVNAIMENRELPHGKDGELAMLGKQFALDLKEIQKKYSYLNF